MEVLYHDFIIFFKSFLSSISRRSARFPFSQNFPIFFFFNLSKRYRVSKDSVSRIFPCRKTLPCCSYSAAETGGLARSSVLVRVDPRPGSANSGSYATIADLEPLYARPCGSRASYYASSHVTHLSQVSCN